MGNTSSEKGTIDWSSPPPAPPPVPPSAFADIREHVTIHEKDVTPDAGVVTENATACCESCYNTIGCTGYVWYTDGSGACHYLSWPAGSEPTWIDRNKRT